MPSEPQPQAALAAIRALQALDLLRVLIRSPTTLLVGALLAAFIGAGAVQSLERTTATPAQAALAVLLSAFVTGFGAARIRTAERDGPFGFLLAQPSVRWAVGVRRAGMAVGAMLVLAITAVAVVRPAALGAWLAPALIGGGIGTLLAATAAAWLPIFDVIHGLSLRARLPSRLAGPLLIVLPWLALVVGAARSEAQAAHAPAQLFAALAIAAAVLPCLRIDPRRLNLLALTPQPMARLILPLAAPAAVIGLIATPPAALAAGLGMPFALGLALVLAIMAGAARIFLGLAALGRSERAANMAGGVELAIVGVMPTTGPAAIGPLALVWVLGRFAWLWRRGGRVRWLDPEDGR